MSQQNELIEIPQLTREEQYKLLRALNRAKRDAIKNNRQSFVVIAFIDGETIFSESHQMERVR